MPSHTQHSQQAQHNEQVSSFLSQAGHARDWEVTTLFYAVVHLVEAKAAPSHHSGDHNERERFVLTNYPSIYPDFKSLTTMCHLVRYRCMQMDLAKLSEAQQWYTSIKQALAA